MIPCMFGYGHPDVVSCACCRIGYSDLRAFWHHVTFLCFWRDSRCRHPNAVTRCYVGTSETYGYCPDCKLTWGGEETVAKRALIQAAADAGVTEQDEVEGRT